MSTLPRDRLRPRRRFPRAPRPLRVDEIGRRARAVIPLAPGADAQPLRILIPILDSLNALPAVRHAAREFGRGRRLEVHLLHVRTQFSLEIARWVSATNEAPSHREAAAKMLGPVRGLLDALSIPYVVHLKEGDRAPVIVSVAGRLKVDRIVLGAARDRSLTRFVEDAVIDKVIDFAPVPVDLISGNALSALERFGVPTGVGAALGFLWLRLND